MSIRKILLDCASEFKNDKALKTSDGFLTYGELYEKSFAVANALYQNGFKNKDFCLIFGLRKSSAYFGLIGSLLAGGAYVPTNPSYPPERNRKIVTTSAARFALLDFLYLEDYRELLLSLQEPLNIITINAPDVSELKKEFKNHNFIDANDYEPILPNIDEPLHGDYVYLLFTSGSTGEPKGVAISNENLENFIKSTKLRYDVGNQDRFIQVFDLTFDFSIYPIFLALSSGAAVYVADGGDLLSPAKFIKENSITHWSSVPTTIGLMNRMRLLKEDVFPSIKYSMFCGEALPYSLALAWQNVSKSALLENTYGPTEATVACTYHKFDEVLSEKYSVNGLVPIGHAFEGMKAVIVNPNDLSYIEDGETGELLLSGVQLADGYFKDEVKTREKFITLSDGHEKTTYYRTGDLVKNTDVGLVFLGRIDTQVKIKGYRFELSEIENAVARCAETTLVVAHTLPVGSSSAESVAVILLDNGKWREEDILKACKDSLPAYAVPSKIIGIKEFPTNSSGKIDRNKLKELL